MKKIAFLLCCILLVLSLTACTQQQNNISITPPTTSHIKSICRLATLECYYNNVAKTVKEKGSNIIINMGEKDRELWIEYSCVVKLGIDMDDVDITIDGQQITIRMPDAKILSKPNQADIKASSYYTSVDSKINKNDIPADVQTKAVEDSMNQLLLEIEADKNLLNRAKERAKELIENHIDNFNEATGAQFEIKWEDKVSILPADTTTIQ